MSLFRVTLFSSLNGVQCINRWNYQSTSIPGTSSLSFSLAAALGFVDGVVPITGNMFTRIRGVTSVNVGFNEVIVENLYDPFDFYTVAFTNNEAGSVAGETLSPISAIGFRTNRVRRDIRRGTKRFVGVSEDWNNGSGILTAAALIAMQELANDMSAPAQVDDGGDTKTFTPVILGLEKYVTPSGNDAYRPYATLAEQEQHVASGFAWEPYDRIRSQVSRQYGNGQ